jgi:hypothetical protein
MRDVITCAALVWQHTLTTVTPSISLAPHSASSLQMNLLRSSTTILSFSSTQPPGIITTDYLLLLPQ